MKYNYTLQNDLIKINEYNKNRGSYEISKATNHKLNKQNIIKISPMIRSKPIYI